VDNKVFIHVERRNKTTVYVSEVRNMLTFLHWIRAESSSKRVADVKNKNLILVLETADGFRAAIGTLRSLDVDEGVSFHTRSQPFLKTVILFKAKYGCAA
jgi:hypothetical protein